MHVVYIAITLLAVAANSYAASLNFAGAESVKEVADRLHVSRSWMIPFGLLLAFGAAGLLIGFAAPALGTIAALGLILYFVCALSAHLRARDPRVGGALSFLALAVAALLSNVAYHHRW
jgi:hypothetical protein